MPEPCLDAETAASELMALIRQLSDEIRSQSSAVSNRKAEAATLDSLLDRELGFDSLTLVELLQRIEQTFNIHLPEQTIGRAETPRDLLREMLRSKERGGATVTKAVEEIVAVHVGTLPDKASTLQEVLHWHLEHNPQRTHLYFYENADQVTPLSYQQLHNGSAAIAANLIQRGIEPGQCVAIMLPTSLEYFYSFMGILLARAIPVPIYPPARPSQLEDHLTRHAGILNNCQARALITLEQGKVVSRLLRSLVDSLRVVINVEELESQDQSINVGNARARDTAFLQYTSGSTGQPKGVILNHTNLLTNIRGICGALQASSDDVFVSWLPLYHDMGLIGAWMCSFYHAIPLVVMSPLHFLSNPAHWLWAIHRYRGTVSAAPNFAYELCLRLNDEALQGLDLSSWRLTLNGAEPVSPSTLQRFEKRFAPYGFRPEAMAPVYGLAECSVGLGFPPLGRTPVIDRIDRNQIEQKGLAVPVDDPDAEAMEVIALGRPLPNHEMRVVDGNGQEVPERTTGTLEFRGPSATSGYYRNPTATKSLFHGNWLNTGDQAYMAGGELYITGRNKDMIIRGGRNIYPHTLEEIVGAIPGVRKGCIAVFGSPDPHTGTERLVVMAETRRQDSEATLELRQTISEATFDLLGMPPDEVVLAPPHTVPKTSSGKIRRAACREIYEQGNRGTTSRSVVWQSIRLMGRGALPALRKAGRLIGDWCFAFYGLLLALLTALLICPIVLLLPRRSMRWRLLAQTGKLLALVTATPLSVQGLKNLPDKSEKAVLVANHSSYLDGLVLIATLPLQCRFAAKAELNKVPLIGHFLARLGVEFVERFDREKSVSDAAHLVDLCRKGEPLMVFPEGTFRRETGLLSFRMGAFQAAADAGVPVVPITIVGTRAKLRAETWMGRRGPVRVVIAPPIAPAGEGWSAALALRDAARQAILERCEEPDLAT